ncbi:unnamed protein product [Closterium sp. Naga37s-1]|nr:unnamed protein product [Closterium sp. Naga37s-1]
MGGHVARLCLSAPLDPPSLPLTPTPLPPHFPRRRLSGVVWSGGALSRCEARLCLSAPLDPPSLPLTPTPLPPHFPRTRLPGVVWSGGALSRCEARLCLSAPLDPPSLPLTPTPLPPHFPRTRLPGVVWSGGALSRCEARLCLYAPLDPPSLPLTPTPLPPHFPRTRLPGVHQKQHTGGGGEGAGSQLPSPSLCSPQRRSSCPFYEKGLEVVGARICGLLCSPATARNTPLLPSFCCPLHSAALSEGAAAVSNTEKASLRPYLPRTSPPSASSPLQLRLLCCSYSTSQPHSIVHDARGLEQGH